MVRLRALLLLLWSFLLALIRRHEFPAPSVFFPAQYIMELTFTQAAKGVNKEISVNMEAACQRCDGKGNEPGTKVQHCHFCNGSGMVRALTHCLSLKCLCAALLKHTCRPPCRRRWTRARLWCAPHVVAVVAKAQSYPPPVTPAVGRVRPSRGRVWWCPCLQVSLTCLFYCEHAVNTSRKCFFIAINKHEKSPSSVSAIVKAMTVCSAAGFPKS